MDVLGALQQGCSESGIGQASLHGGLCCPFSNSMARKLINLAASCECLQLFLQGLGSSVHAALPAFVVEYGQANNAQQQRNAQAIKRA